MNATNGSDGQHKIRLDSDRGPLYETLGFCFGGAALSMDARRLRGIPSPADGVGIMDTVVLLALFLISGLLIVMPPVAVWRCLSQQAQGRAAWLYPALSLIGPFVSAFICLVLMWLPRYSGECGGWLGEVARCSGFSQYATETMFVAALGIAMPGILGMLLGVVVLVLGLIRR